MHIQTTHCLTAYIVQSLSSMPDRTSLLGLSHIPADLVAQYPDVQIDLSEHAQLFKAKYAGVFTGFSEFPARVEAMRTEQWGELDLTSVLSCETYIDMADVDRIKAIRAYVLTDDRAHLLNKIEMWPIFVRPFICPEGWKSDGGIECIDKRKPDDRWYGPIVFDIAPNPNDPNIVYTVDWRSGAVTLMPIDLVKVHLYTQISAPRWLHSHPGVPVFRLDGSKVPEHASIERWWLCKAQQEAISTFEAFMPAMTEYKL